MRTNARNRWRCGDCRRSSITAGTAATFFCILSRISNPMHSLRKKGNVTIGILRRYFIVIFVILINRICIVININVTAFSRSNVSICSIRSSRTIDSVSAKSNHRIRNNCPRNIQSPFILTNRRNVLYH